MTILSYMKKHPHFLLVNNKNEGCPVRTTLIFYASASIIQIKPMTAAPMDVYTMGLRSRQVRLKRP